MHVPDVVFVGQVGLSYDGKLMQGCVEPSGGEIVGILLDTRELWGKPHDEPVAEVRVGADDIVG